MIYRLTFEKVEKVFGYCIIIREHQNYVIRLEQEAEKDNDIYPPENTEKKSKMLYKPCSCAVYFFCHILYQYKFKKNIKFQVDIIKNNYIFM